MRRLNIIYLTLAVIHERINTKKGNNTNMQKQITKPNKTIKTTKTAKKSIQSARQSARQDSMTLLLEGLKIQLQFGITHNERIDLIERIDTILKGTK